MEKMEDVEGGLPTMNSIENFDVKMLFQVETYSDGVHGDIVKLTPVDEHGVRDVDREVRFGSSVSILFRGRQVTHRFGIEGAKSLSEAIEKFPEAAKLAALQEIDRLESQHRQSQLASGGMGLGNRKLVMSS